MNQDGCWLPPALNQHVLPIDYQLTSGSIVRNCVKLIYIFQDVEKLCENTPSAHTHQKANRLQTERWTSNLICVEREDGSDDNARESKHTQS